MKKILPLIIFMLLAVSLCAQISVERQVIGSTGNLTNSGAIIASSNVGEAVIPTFTQATLVATQGFEQPDTLWTVGINTIDASTMNILVYPNPTDDKLTIEAPQNSVLKFLNVEGQLIETFATNCKKTNVDVSGLASGMYFVEVKTEKELAVIKFVKE